MFSYLIFGGLTTLINIGAYLALYHLCNLGNLTSNAIAWILSVLFAFFTNRRYVFKSVAHGAEIVRELFRFIVLRLASGGVDMLIMYGTVSVMGWNETVFKIVSNIIVVVLNYIFSKSIIFKMER